MAMTHLGSMYAEEGATQNFEQARLWFQTGAELGNADCMRFLATMYTNGDGVKKDAAKAQLWLRKAATTAPGDGPRDLRFHTN